MSGRRKNFRDKRSDLINYHIKRFPEDFVVEEVLPLKIKEKGEYSYYLLKKKNYTTLEVIDILSRKLRIPRYRFGLSGLKDRRAVTFQYISIEDGPSVDIKERSWSLKFLGYGQKPIEIGQAEGNLFTITVRDIDPERVEEGLLFISKEGFANYFGRQRFSPDLFTKVPVAKLLLQGRIEDALKEYLTQQPDKGRARRLKSLWGKWDLLLNEADHLSHQEKNALRVLKREGSFERAFRVLPKQIKLMFFFSYQSRLWNRLLKRIISKSSSVFKVPFAVEGELVFYKKTDEVVRMLKSLCLPYISNDIFNAELPEVLRYEIFNIVREEGIEDKLNAEVAGLKVFNPGHRKAVVKPSQVQVLERAKNKLRVRFFLPSGSYATVMMAMAIYFPHSGR